MRHLQQPRRSFPVILLAFDLEREKKVRRWTMLETVVRDGVPLRLILAELKAETQYMCSSRLRASSVPGHHLLNITNPCLPSPVCLSAALCAATANSTEQSRLTRHRDKQARTMRFLSISSTVLMLQRIHLYRVLIEAKWQVGGGPGVC